MLKTVSLLLLFAVLVSSSLFASDSDTDRPNILFVYLDDFGWKDTGFMGSDFFETPNLDRLASQGMVFTNAYAGAANCAPSRACLLSGQYSPRHKIYNVGTRARGKAQFRRLKHVPGVNVLNPEIKTWAQRLQKSGYATATMGKWHLSDDPVPYGFDLNIGGSHAGGPPRGYYPPHPNVPGLANAPNGEYVTDRLATEAINFIRKNKDRPWAIFLTHFAVHTPLNAKKELLAKYKSKPPGKLHQHVNMATMIQAVDDGVGLIQNALEELGLVEKTIIVFYSDNGGYGPATDMAPLKGYKGTYYEGGIRVPFFVKWPGKVTPESSSSEPITAVDIYPTLCEMAGAGLPENQILDGESLVPLLTGEKKSLADETDERAIFWHFPAYLQSYRDVNDEQRDPLFRTRPCSVMRMGDWKLHQYFEDGGLELYNLNDDVGETQNLSEKYPKRTKNMLTRLKAWQQETGADIPSVPNPEFDSAVEAAALKK